jgi:hypothetical protein
VPRPEQRPVLTDLLRYVHYPITKLFRFNVAEDHAENQEKGLPHRTQNCGVRHGALTN